MAIYELRTYDIKVGRLADYLATFETRGAPVLRRYAEATGFWSLGATESGKLDRVNHIWHYDSIADRLARRSALYADPAWMRDFVPLAFDTFERLEGRLMVLDPASEASLAAALAGKGEHAEGPHRQEPGSRGQVVARIAPPSQAPAPAPSIARWRFITGKAGATLSLDYLDAVSLEDRPWSEGCDVEIWQPTRFSAIR